MATLLRETTPEFRDTLVAERPPSNKAAADERAAELSRARTLPRLAIVVPCFNEEEVLLETARRLGLLLDRLGRADRVAAGSRVVFIDDGSRDRTWTLIEQLSRHHLAGHCTRFVRFAAVGGVATAIQYALLILLVRDFAMAPTPASSIGFVLSAGVNYLLNYRFTFQSDRPHGPAAAKFGLLAGTGLLINAAIMRLMTGAGMHYLIAQVCATALVLCWNFIGNSFWTFGVRPVDERTRT